MYARDSPSNRYTPAAYNNLPNGGANAANRASTGNHDGDDLGKFPLLNDLIRPGTLHRPNHEHANPKDIDPGHIIYISNGGNGFMHPRFNQRAMLVGITRRRCLRCYPIERFSPRVWTRNHWHLRQDAPSRHDPLRSGSTMYANFDNNVRIATDLTVNLDDSCDVDVYGGSFRIVGRAQDESFEGAIAEIRILQNADLDDIRPFASRASIPTPQPSVSPCPPPLVHNPPPQAPPSPSVAPPSECIGSTGSQDIVVNVAKNVIRKNGTLCETRKREPNSYPFGKKARKKQ